MNYGTFRRKHERRHLYILALLAPFFVFFPIVQLSQFFSLRQLSSNTNFEYWYLMPMMSLAYLYFLLNSFFNRLLIEKSGIYRGNFNHDCYPLANLVEISGDSGSIENDFRECLYLHFSTGENIELFVDEYEDGELNKLLDFLRKQCPNAVFSYSEVIPLESRGLLRFIENITSSKAEHGILRLSRSAMETTFIDLLKSNTRLFFSLYFILWIVVVIALSGYCLYANTALADSANTTFIWDSSTQTREFAKQYFEFSDAGAESLLDKTKMAYLNVLLFLHISMDFFQTTGLSLVSGLWMLIFIVVGIGFPLANCFSPRFVFIDPKSIGMRMIFLKWESIIGVSIRKNEYMSDPLDGVLNLKSDCGRELDIDLSRIPEAKNREQILRFCNQYASAAILDENFLRLSTTVADMRYTDLWLAQSEMENAARRQSEVLIEKDDTDERQDCEIHLENSFSIDISRREKEALCVGVETAIRTGIEKDSLETFHDAPVSNQVSSSVSFSNSDSNSDFSREPVDSKTVSLVQGRFKLLSSLGYGGQGTTHIAIEQDADGKDLGKVVIKQMILPRYADVRILQNATSRFKDAANLLSSLDHPGIVGLRAAFVEDGCANLVMEYIPGTNLRELVCEHGKLPPSKVIELGVQIASLLAYLHELNPPIIHCDLAPDNLILTPSGKLFLVDFDVARVLDSRIYSSIAGRPSYTAPEQFRGEPQTGSDLYSFGAILYFLLVGNDPPPLGLSSKNEPIDENGNEQSSSEFRLRSLITELGNFEVSERPSDARQVETRLRSIKDKLELGENEHK